MTNVPGNTWTTLEPPLPSKASQNAFVEHARALAKVCRRERTEEAIEKARGAFVAEVTACRRSDRQALLAAGLVMTDLATQGWTVRVRSERVEVKPPDPVTDPLAEKARIRRQELVKRNAQLRQPSVQRFLDSMERQRLHDGRYVSIYSLMRDGRDLAEGLREARTHLNNGWADALSKLVDPYLQFVTAESAACEFTGLRLMDVWRYFRHTWTNQYTSVPGRTMVFLVRDRAAANHPVMGIGALSSPIMQIRERDSWIGWHPETFLDRVRTAPTRELAKWLVDTLDAAIDEIYVADLIEDGILSTRDLKTPSLAVIERLLKESAEARKKHHRFARSRDHKQKRSDFHGDEYWIAKARTHLFRSKRALALSTYLRARAVLDEAFGGKPTAEKLATLAKTGYGSDAIRRVLKKAKAAGSASQGKEGFKTLLHPTTLKRISDDVDRERRGRDWLRGARRAAEERAKIRGLTIGRSTNTTFQRREEARRSRTTRHRAAPRATTHRGVTLGDLARNPRPLALAPPLPAGARGPHRIAMHRRGRGGAPAREGTLPARPPTRPAQPLAPARRCAVEVRAHRRATRVPPARGVHAPSGHFVALQGRQ
ncbi:Druantia anti-phage system protein DruA [Rhodanobacter lindaniclasticus]